ncbi:MAG: 50S ribosomal protein L29 [Deltaproteobacteria bacterium RIFCSPLOWO2_02_FULL_44_10]|nr:MAG: 50S ribosomal protein L29 [Deltaproteobacteria bacterium RIFCSPHIGHO2_02_FULL_44_16]OGQ45580.1 MAG: 50S ribosomal protein L29 [Deltaproteobacteria bacterium RIFCSPLOWO2_02_FULL_44_10]
MKQAEVKQRSLDELMRNIDSLHQEKFQLRVKKSLGQLKQTSELRRVQRALAKLLTERTRRSKEALNKESS